MSTSHKPAEQQLTEWTIVHLHLTTKEAFMKSGSLKENLMNEVKEAFDDINESVEFAIRLLDDGETRENIREFLTQLSARLLS